MLRGRVASSLPRGMPPRFDPQTQGGLASGLEGLVPRGAAPVPLFLLVRVTKNPQPLSSTTYLREKKFA